MTTADRAARLASTVLAAAVTPLLHRMRNELDRDGTLRRGTQRTMWTAYATFGLLLTDSLVRHNRDVPIGQRVAGYTVAAAGTALAVGSMTTFASPQQLNGGETGDLITGGIYDYSRHPQYAGFVAATAGLATARGSPRAALLAIELAVIMRTWAVVEEEHLRRQFGEAYERLCSRVPRWIGVPAEEPAALASQPLAPNT
ncbi:Phospholipid methyltransferase [Pseudonocardia ammonioxydans]|uniref:Phospholipid methyltransferase n=1 Tax=Pseudonocardia ammonioxydans TaxID=260086 RepID=A0A1I5GVD6_PSUAM|nr:isoprenylcysteine carboxylmethyltransferase family protein [Pseudonocardia ammonioxydans]SFO40014.1 Phospholipid methyltransferase [Pseudonocardia ammonioxydans]